MGIKVKQMIQELAKYPPDADLAIRVYKASGQTKLVIFQYISTTRQNFTAIPVPIEKL